MTFIEWFNNLTTEAMIVFVYMMTVGILYGFRTTIIYLRGIIHNITVENDLLGYTLYITWLFSVLYWFIF